MTNEVDDDENKIDINEQMKLIEIEQKYKYKYIK